MHNLPMTSKAFKNNKFTPAKILFDELMLTNKYSYGEVWMLLSLILRNKTSPLQSLREDTHAPNL